MNLDEATKLMQSLSGDLSSEYGTMVKRNIDLLNRMKSLSDRHQSIIEQFHNNLNMIESGIAAVEQFSLGVNQTVQIEAPSRRERARL